jgi:prepilin-type N-terminal cleavage/methylation domain-containing protein
MNRHRSRGARRLGFTLVELMIAMAAGSFTIAAAYSLATLSAANYAAQTQVSETQVAVRTAMEQIRRDFARAGFLGARNVQTEHAGCDGSLGSLDVTGDATTVLRGLQVTIDGSLNATLTTLLDLPRNPSRLDSITLWGNYATSDSYRINGDLDESRTILRFQPNKESFRRSFYTPGTAGAAPTYDPARFRAAFQPVTAPAVYRWVRVESEGKFWFRAVTGVNATSDPPDLYDPPSITVSPALPPCFNYRFAVVSPLSRITYRVSDLTADPIASVALARLQSATPTPGSTRAVLLRQEENIATGDVDDMDSVRLVLDYATEFVVNGVANTAGAGVVPTFFHRDEDSAPTIQDELPERMRSLRVRISARSADANPNLPHVARANRNAPFVAYQVPIAGAPVGTFWASVRTMSAEIFLPNLVQQP